MLLASLTEGFEAAVYGAPRMVCFLVLAFVALWSSNISRLGGRTMAVGALLNASAALVFAFVNAGIYFTPEHTFLGPDGILVRYAELIATPALVIFTFGFCHEAIRLGGWKFGRSQ